MQVENNYNNQNFCNNANNNNPNVNGIAAKINN